MSLDDRRGVSPFTAHVDEPFDAVDSFEHGPATPASSFSSSSSSLKGDGDCKSITALRTADSPSSSPDCFLVDANLVSGSSKG